MYNTLANIGLFFSIFYASDKLITRHTNLEGVYYLLHSIHNAAIVYLTAGDVYNSLTNFNYVFIGEKNLLALSFVFALHFYHIAAYKTKLRFDDWLHHILMIGVALPIGWYLNSGPLMGFNLFFTTGLPGGIDYILLFLTRNGFVDRSYEKSVNAWLNTWIRSPGCVAHATLTLAYMSVQPNMTADWYLGTVVAGLTFWNGQYFMRQVVENNARINS
jgi:hypothetical protein